MADGRAVGSMEAAQGAPGTCAPVQNQGLNCGGIDFIGDVLGTPIDRRGLPIWCSHASGHDSRLHHRGRGWPGRRPGWLRESSLLWCS